MNKQPSSQGDLRKLGLLKEVAKGYDDLFLLVVYPFVHDHMGPLQKPDVADVAAGGMFTCVDSLVVRPNHTPGES